MSDRVPVGLAALELVVLAEPVEDPLLGLLLRQTGQVAGVLVHAPVETDDGDLRQPMVAPDLEVDRIVAGRDLERTGPERRIHTGVGNDRHSPLDVGNDHLLADEVPVALVVRVHRHADVTENRRRSHSRDRDRARSVRERIARRRQRVVDVAMDDLEIRHRRPAARAPVHDPVVPVNPAAFVQVDEEAQDGADVVVVHREALARVVERRTDLPKLAHDNPAVLLQPAPGALDERIPAELVPARPLREELALDDRVHGDRGVVVARLPEHVEAAHAMPPDEHVLRRRVQRMPHVQVPGHVGGRQRDRERLARRLGIGCDSGPRLPRSAASALRRPWGYRESPSLADADLKAALQESDVVRQRLCVQYTARLGCGNDVALLLVEPCRPLDEGSRLGVTACDP